MVTSWKYEHTYAKSSEQEWNENNTRTFLFVDTYIIKIFKNKFFYLYNIYANPEYTAVVRINECVRKFFVVM